MAGSYNHVVKDDGNLESNEVVADMLENGGDVFEAVEEMYGMIWFLAGDLSGRSIPDGAESVVIKARVEAALKNYKKGLDLAKAVNSI